MKSKIKVQSIECKHERRQLSRVGRILGQRFKCIDCGKRIGWISPSNAVVLWNGIDEAFKRITCDFCTDIAKYYAMVSVSGKKAEKWYACERDLKYLE